jgi:hypothetical protein
MPAPDDRPGAMPGERRADPAPTFRFSRGRSVRDSEPEQRAAPTFAAFVDALDGDRAGTVKSDTNTPYFCGPLNGTGRRRAEGALPKPWTAIDLDGIKPEVLPDLRMYLARFSGCCWSTHSSRPDSPRERVVLELDRDATRDECIRLGDNLKAELDAAFPAALVVDVSTFRPEQPCYLPPAAVPIARFAGDPLKVDAYLAARPPAEPPEAPQPSDREADDLLARLSRGDGLHDVLLALVGRMAAKGLDRATIDAAARGMLELARPARGARVDEVAGDELTRMVDGALAKYAPGVSAAPVDIFREMATPALPPEMFPSCVSEYATVHARAAGHDPAAYLVAMLSAAASAIGDGICVELDPRTRWTECARLWLLLLGAPGSAKTPAIRVAVAPIQAIHKDMAVEHARALAGAGKDELPPPRRAMLVNDATVEALSDVLMDNPRGVQALYEELDSWIGSHDCYRNGQGSKDRGDWLRTYDGGPHQINRVKRGAVFVPNWSVSILGATTPAGLRRHARDLPADGLIQRFLTVIVRPMCAADESVEQGTIDDARRRYEQRLNELFNARGGVVRLSSDAAEVFTTRRDALRGEVSAMASFSEPFAGHMAKHPAMLGRLALVFHCLEHGAAAVDTELAGDTMARAAFVLKQLTRHSLALFSMLAGDSGPSALARACGSSIVAAGAETVTRRDLIAKCRAFKDAAEQAREAALRFLVDAAWITPINEERQYAGRPARFRVHPEVHARFSEQGEALRARRSALREAFE